MNTGVAEVHLAGHGVGSQYTLFPPVGNVRTSRVLPQQKDFG